MCLDTTEEYFLLENGNFSLRSLKKWMIVAYKINERVNDERQIQEKNAFC